MKPIHIKSTKKTPAIYLDMKSGRLLITGISMMCDPKKTYLQLVEKVKEYALNPSAQAKVSILLQHTNCGSLLFLVEILRLLKDAKCEKEMWVDWLYDTEDTELLENIKIIESILKISIHKVAYIHTESSQSIDLHATMRAYDKNRD